MLPFVLLALAVVLVIAIGLIFVGWAVGRTESMPDQIVIDGQEAVDFCAQAMPDTVAAELAYEDLPKILRLHLEWIQAHHLTPEGSGEGPVLFEEYDAVDYILERADVSRLDVTREQVAAAVSAHSAYLQVMGVIHIEEQELVEADLADLPLLDPAEVERALDHRSEGGAANLTAGDPVDLTEEPGPEMS